MTGCLAAPGFGRERQWADHEGAPDVRAADRTSRRCAASTANGGQHCCRPPLYVHSGLPASRPLRFQDDGTPIDMPPAPFTFAGRAFCHRHVQQDAFRGTKPLSRDHCLAFASTGAAIPPSGDGLWQSTCSCHAPPFATALDHALRQIRSKPSSGVTPSLGRLRFATLALRRLAPPWPTAAKLGRNAFCLSIRFLLCRVQAEALAAHHTPSGLAFQHSCSDHDGNSFAQPQISLAPSAGWLRCQPSMFASVA